MDQAKHKTDFGARLRRNWNVLMRVLEAMDRSPMEDVFGRLDRLESKMAALKNRKAADAGSSISDGRQC